ncbi:MAG TPA: DUF6323 family protein [Desulfitobacteriaceae bacterium]|nr:DUF6323 family protein [Desulfitobacteriaceae bacterium]
MSFEISVFSGLLQKQAAAELEKCNDFTAQFGLILSRRDVVELVETRSLALTNNGRIEFEGGVMEKIIRQFCDSPHLSMNNYAETLHDLIEMFYYYKNETLDLISDDDLIKFMKKSYDGICQGSLELLSGRELARMARNVRFGYDPDYREDPVDDKDVEDGEY